MVAYFYFVFCVSFCLVDFTRSTHDIPVTTTPSALREDEFEYPVATTSSIMLEDDVTYPLATTPNVIREKGVKTRYEQGFDDYEEANVANTRQGRGMMDHDEDVMDHHPEMMEMKTEEKAVKQDPWAGYYDFLINEGSFKFWAVFQLATALLLIYSACAAIYYAKLNPIAPDYDYYDDFFGRSASGSSPSRSVWSGLSPDTFQRIFTAISSKKYS